MCHRDHGQIPAVSGQLVDCHCIESGPFTGTGAVVCRWKRVHLCSLLTVTSQSMIKIWQHSMGDNKTYYFKLLDPFLMEVPLLRDIMKDGLGLGIMVVRVMIAVVIASAVVVGDVVVLLSLDLKSLYVFRLVSCVVFPSSI